MNSKQRKSRVAAPWMYFAYVVLVIAFSVFFEMNHQGLFYVWEFDLPIGLTPMGALWIGIALVCGIISFCIIDRPEYYN